MLRVTVPRPTCEQLIWCCHSRGEGDRSDEDSGAGPASSPAGRRANLLWTDGEDDCDREGARKTLRQVTARYPIVVTRDLTSAKDSVRAHARGSEQYGLVASSQAMRLKPHAIDVRVSVDPIHWFLGEPSDTRSSYYLEDAATEFQVQGLEVDWACVTWDADLRLVDGAWQYHSFRGDIWTNVNKADRQRYLLNAYRVLLTRARQGMAIFVPPGDDRDPTRLPKFYDGTFEYLRELGLSLA